MHVASVFAERYSVCSPGSQTPGGCAEQQPVLVVFYLSCCVLVVFL